MFDELPKISNYGQNTSFYTPQLSGCYNPTDKLNAFKESAKDFKYGGFTPIEGVEGVTTNNAGLSDGEYIFNSDNNFFNNIITSNKLEPFTVISQDVGIGTTSPNQKLVINNMTKRIVRVIISDSDSRVPLDETVLYDSGEKFTELSDQELYYELDFKEIVESHNSKRTKIVDKQASKGREKEVFLDPIRIKDLKMSVVNIAIL